jgi:hypothetical protein
LKGPGVSATKVVEYSELKEQTPGPLMKRSTGGVAALPRTAHE